MDLPRRSTRVSRRRTTEGSNETENVKDLRKKISDLEQKYTKLYEVNSKDRKSYFEKAFVLEKAQKKMFIKFRKATKRATSLEQQLRKLQGKHADKTRNFESQITFQLTKISDLEATNYNVQKENQDLRLKLKDQSTAEEKNVQGLQERAEEAEKGAADAQQEVEILRSQLTEIENRFAKSQAELAEAKNQAADNESYKNHLKAAREAQKKSSTDLITLQANLRKEQIKCQKLAKKCRKVKDTLKSTVRREKLLKEQLLSSEIDITILKGQLHLSESEVSILNKQLREKGDVEGERNNLRKSKMAPTLTEPTRTNADDSSASGKSSTLLELELKLKECIAENESLKARFKSNAEGNNTPATSDSTLLQQKTELGEQLRALLRRYELLKEKYDYETKQFHTVCTQLFGYRVHFTKSCKGQNHNVFKIQNFDAQGPDEVFIFEEGVDKLHLLHSPIFKHFENEIYHFLQQGPPSVPGFLAAVTNAYLQGYNYNERRVRFGQQIAGLNGFTFV